MLDQYIEAVFENGVFRPLQPVHLSEHQLITLTLPTEEESFDEKVGHEPLPLQQCKTVRVRLKRVADFGPVPYPVETHELEHE